MRKPRRLPSAGSLLGVLVATTMLAPSASATHSSIEQVSSGAAGGNAPVAAAFGGASADGRSVFFTTTESLVAGDTDATADVYERSNGVTALVSTGPMGGNGAFSARFAGSTPDGSHVYFETSEKLVSADTDSARDVYERFAGATTLVSTGGTASFSSFFDGVSTDGARVFFETSERLLSADTDSSIDIYERSGGATALVSTGPAGGNAAVNAVYDGVSADGSHVFFDTTEALVAADTDSVNDVYDRTGGGTVLVSTGPTGGNGPQEAYFDGASATGARVFFETIESLVTGDTDAFQDIYERSGGTTTLVSTGPVNANGSFDALFDGISDDGSRVFFTTDGALVGTDTDSQFDVYERAGGTTTLLSTGPVGGNGLFDAFFDGSSASGSHVFFDTDEALTSSDADFTLDVYDRSAGVTSLASTGPAGSGPYLSFYDGTSATGNHLFFSTDQRLVSADTDASVDVYDRSGGVTRLVSTGPAGGNGAFDVIFEGNSSDGSRSFLETQESLLPSDTDAVTDVYGATATFGHPATAGTLASSLVPVFRQCGAGANAPTASHAAPLSVGACAPAPTTGVVAYLGAHATASAVLTAVPGDPSTSADEADVALGVNAGDVRSGSPTGPDYDPNPAGADLTAVFRLRLTDTANGGSGVDPGTTTDFDFSFAVTCAATLGADGSSCSANTSADAIMPGAIDEARETVLQVFRLRLNDSGPDGVRGSGDDKLFAQEGLFAP